MSATVKVKISKQAQAQIDEQIYTPYRNRIVRKLSEDLKSSRVNSKTWTAINTSLNALYAQEIVQIEAIVAQHP